ncbi:MAG: histidine kinase [Rhodobacteraceae bacterium]|nr:histidine kinase [Paracoccaceae bacterium]
MTGKLIGAFIVLSSLAAGIAVYYLQVYGYYDDVSARIPQIHLTTVANGIPEPILADNIRAIDATSSPLRFRACFDTPHSQAMLTEEFVVYETPVPLVAPGWFDCFDAAAVGEALENEAAIAYLGQADIHEGVDRVVAVFDDGRAFSWHQLNEKYPD